MDVMSSAVYASPLGLLYLTGVPDQMPVPKNPLAGFPAGKVVESRVFEKESAAELGGSTAGMLHASVKSLTFAGIVTGHRVPVYDGIPAPSVIHGRFSGVPVPGKYVAIKVESAFRAAVSSVGPNVYEKSSQLARNCPRFWARTTVAESTATTAAFIMV
jgi:hypothetical protein